MQHQLAGLKDIVETQGSSMKLVALKWMWRRMGMFKQELQKQLTRLVDLVAAVSEADSLAVRIQKQLKTTAIQALDSREARKLTLPRLMAATAHDLLREPLKLQRQWHCSRCGHTIAHKHLREWLMNGPCVPLLHTAVPDLFHAGQPALIGLQATHGSHKLACKRGIWWCVACRSWATSAARYLSRPCAGQPTKGAQDVLARLDKGLPPQLHVQWQSPHH